MNLIKHSVHLYFFPNCLEPGLCFYSAVRFQWILSNYKAFKYFQHCDSNWHEELLQFNILPYHQMGIVLLPQF